MRRTRSMFLLFCSVLGSSACADEPRARQAPPPTPIATSESSVTPAVLALEHPVPLWEDGKITGELEAATAARQGYVIMDLGEAWTPYLFTDGQGPDGTAQVNAYRRSYLQLARGDFQDDYQGRRARDDKYLELYGILPSFSWLRERMHRLAGLDCVKQLDLRPLESFRGLSSPLSARAAKLLARDYAVLSQQVWKLAKRQGALDLAELDPARLRPSEQRLLERFSDVAATYLAVDAVQQRLTCEGFLSSSNAKSKAKARGVFDANTRLGLIAFERRHRVFGWGSLSGDTLAMLRVPPLEAELGGVVHVVTERAIHAAGVLEDGSTGLRHDGDLRTFHDRQGREHPIPNLTAELQRQAIDAFGLHTPDSALAWLESLGELPAEGHRLAAFRGPTLPEYYSDHMDIRIEVDRGDVWYDFPFDDVGRSVPQPAQYRPTLTVVARYLEQDIPLARYPTTIGGWRTKQIGDTPMWRYQESPVGKRVWSEIVAAPVWIPPDTTMLKALLKPNPKLKAQEPPYEVNYYLTGPGYASAFGLVAAYHSRFGERPDGSIASGGDEGIRTHGSAEYMSILRRQSNGCHRLHNHVAVRLMSWVLAHRQHRRQGQLNVAFKRSLEFEAHVYDLELKQGGYVFELDPPLPVEVKEGRIRGKLQKPIAFDIPLYDPVRGAYVNRDGTAVRLQGDHLVPVAVPPAPAAATDSVARAQGPDKPQS